MNIAGRQIIYIGEFLTNSPIYPFSCLEKNPVRGAKRMIVFQRAMELGLKEMQRLGELEPPNSPEIRQKDRSDLGE